MPLEIGALLNERYRIERVLGQGGFGAVYLATDEHLGIKCAVKENLSLSPESERQFKREATLLATLRHPNLPRVTHHFVLANQHYLVMDFVEGENLKQRLGQVGTFSQSDALHWIELIGNALSYLHDQDPPVIHRDIKPANIRITPTGQAILVDFGLAKAAATGQATSRGARGVTPGYAPPEQYGLGHSDTVSDLFSLGATLYCLLTGKVPPDSVERLVGKESLTLPLDLRPDLEPNISAAIVKAMECRREDRFQNVAEFLAALKDESFRYEPSIEIEKDVEREPEVEEIPAPERKPKQRALRFALIGLAVSSLAAGLVFFFSPDLLDIIPVVQNLLSGLPRVDVLHITPIPDSILQPGAISGISITRTPRKTLTPAYTPTPRFTATNTPLPEPITLESANAWRLFSTWRRGSPSIPIAMSPDGRSVAVYEGQGVEILNLLTGETIQSLQGIAVTEEIKGLTLLEETLLVKFKDELLRWSIDTNNLIERFKIPGESILVSRDGRYMATRDKFISIYDLEAGKLLITLGEERSRQKFAFSLDGKYFALTIGKNVELWNLNTVRSERRMPGHGEPIEGLAFTPDGGFLVSASGDIWDLTSGELTGYFDSAAETVAISSNGELIVGNDGSVWEYSSGGFVGSIPVENEALLKMMFTPDSNFLVRQLKGGEVQLWTTDPNSVVASEELASFAGFLSDGEEFTTLNVSRIERTDEGVGSALSNLTLSPDQTLAAGWGGREVDVVDLRTLASIATFKLPSTVADAAFLGNDFIVTVSRWGGVDRWEISSQKNMQHYDLQGDSIEASPIGNLFAVQEKYIYVVDSKTGEVKYRLGSKDARQEFTFTPDGKYLAIAAGSGVRFWDLSNGRPGMQFSGHGPNVANLVFTPDSERMISASGDVWDVESGKLIAYFDTGADRLAVNPHGELIAGSDGSLWDGNTGQYLGDLEANASHLGFSATNRHLAWRDINGTVYIYHVRPIQPHTTPQIQAVEVPHLTVLTMDSVRQLHITGWWGEDPLLRIRLIEDELDPRARILGNEGYNDIALSPNGQSFTALNEHGIDLLDPITGQLIDRYRIFLNPSTIREIAYLDKHLLVRKTSAGVERWDLESRSMVQRYFVDGSSIVVSPDGKWFALQKDGQVQVIDAISGDVEYLFNVSEGRQAFQFSPDGDYLAVARGVFVEVYDMKTGKREKRLRGHSAIRAVTGLAFTPDASHLIAASGDIWDFATGARVGTFEKGAEQVAVSPSGSFLVLDDGAIRETATGDRAGTLVDLRASAVDFLITPDGKQILWRTEDSRVHCWGVYAGTPTEVVSPAESALTADDVGRMGILSHVGRGRLLGALWSPDDRYLAVNTSQNTVIYQSSNLMRIFATLDARTVGFDEDGHVLIGGKQSLTLRDIHTGDVIEDYGKKHITAAAYSPDGKWLAIAGMVTEEGNLDGLALINLFDGLFYVIDNGTGRYEEVTRLAFTPNSRYLAQSFHGGIMLWDIETGIKLRDTIVGNIAPAAMSPAGDLVAYINQSSVCVETLEKGGRNCTISAGGESFFGSGLDVPDLRPFDYTFKKDGTFLVFYRKLNRRTLEESLAYVEWDVERGVATHTAHDLINLSGMTSVYAEDYLNEKPQRIPDIGLSPSEKYIYSLTVDGVVRIYDYPSRQVTAAKTSDYLDVMALSPEGDVVAIANGLGGVEIFNIVAGESISVIQGDWFPVWIDFISPSILMVLQEDSKLSVLNSMEGEVIESYLDERYEDGAYAALSPNGSLFAIMQIVGGRKHVNVFSLSPERPLYDIGRFPLPFKPVFSPDNQHLAVARRNEVELWDVQTRTVGSVLDGIGMTIGPVSFSPDGSHLISASGEIWDISQPTPEVSFDASDATIEVITNGNIIVGQDGIVWDIKTGAMVGSIDGIRGSAVSFAFSPDGERLIWQTKGGVVEVWGVSP